MSDLAVPSSALQTLATRLRDESANNGYNEDTRRAYRRLAVQLESLVAHHERLDGARRD